jgi:hypothetical protein
VSQSSEFVAITLCVASRVVIAVGVYLVTDSVWKLLDTPSYRNRVSTLHVMFLEYNERNLYIY